MGISVVDQFNYQGSKFNFERDAFNTLAEMKAFPETSVPPKGFECYCAETDKKYKFDVSNSIDPTTGKWREVESGGSGTGYKTITWDNSSNMNNYKTEGIYLIKGIHSNSGDNLPITAYANGDIGGVLTVSVSTEDSTTKEQIISQSLILGNRVGAETKQYIRSCIVKDSTETWTAWKEANTILYFGEKASGQATRADIDAAIDNGQYAGVYVGTDGFLPQGATFTLTVINNYAANASSSLPANNRQVTQIFIYTPLSTNGNVNKSVVCKRDGIGESTVSWGTLSYIQSSDNIYFIKSALLNEKSDVETITNALGSVNAFKTAYENNNIFLILYSNDCKSVVNVTVNDSEVEISYIVNYITSDSVNTLLYKKFSYSGDNWTACTLTDFYEFAPHIKEAPEDSKTYGRKNGEWVPVSEGGGSDINLNDIIIPFYKCESGDEYAIPIDENDLTDLIVFEWRYGTNIKRVKNGATAWRMTIVIYFDSSSQNLANLSCIINNGYLYVRSKPYGVYKINLEDGTYINNRTDINNVVKIALFDGKLYAAESNKLVSLSLEDLSLIENIELNGSTISGSTMSVYDDRMLVCCNNKLLIIKSEGTTEEISTDTVVYSAFMVNKSTYVSLPFYIIFVGNKIRTIAEDLTNDFTSDGILKTTISSNSFNDCLCYTVQGGWSMLVLITPISSFVMPFPGNTAINTNNIITNVYNASPIFRNETSPVETAYSVLYLTPTYNYIINRNGVMYKQKTMIL